MKNWNEDKDLEKAMLQTSLLFLKAKVKDSRASLFHKYVLALIISGKAKSVEDVQNCYQRTYPNNYIDSNKIDSALKSLKKLVSIDSNGNFLIDKQTKEEANNYLDGIQKDLDRIVDDVFNSVKSTYRKSIANETQVKSNIKECFEYYFRVASISFFGFDERKDINEYAQIESIARNNLNQQSDELYQQILYSIGQVLDNPSDNQLKTLDEMARIHVTSQIMNLDPMLANFNSVQLRSKAFILDTDVVLYAITENAQHSKQYKMMLKQLSACGCKIYIPQEVIQEVYNHAEASLKRYQFVSHLIGIKNEDAPKNFKNVFIEDFHCSKLKKDKPLIDWQHYIRDYYDSEFGVAMMADVIKDVLGKDINYGTIPHGARIDAEEKEILYKRVLEETQKTDKAYYRENEKNEDIANTDTVIYLSVKSLNEKAQDEKSSPKKSDILMKDFYFLSSSTRVHLCAKELSLDSKIICNPRELFAYLAEIGNIDKDGIRYTQLFDNPFMAYTAKIVSDDIDTLVKSGVDVSGGQIVRMKYELSKEIQNLLTVNNTEEYIRTYNEITSKGFKYTDVIADTIDGRNADKLQIEQLEGALFNAKKTIEFKDKEIAKLKYQGRTQKNSLRKRNEKTR